jgi:hypothetical protein
MRLQGKSKEQYDASEFIAFVGVVGAGISILGYLIFLFLLVGCQAPEIPEPVNTPNYVASYTIHVQPNGSTAFPKFIPVFK